MWNPDFSPVSDHPALLRGWHRSMCILSTLYRGTAACPGLVLGLDRGGSCWGKALSVHEHDWPAIRARLDARELPTAVYDARFLPVTLADGRRVSAYCYVVRRNHPQYWNGDDQQAAALIRQGYGQNGSSRDYLSQTIDRLRHMGLPCGTLNRLLRLVDIESR